MQFLRVWYTVGRGGQAVCYDRDESGRPTLSTHINSGTTAQPPAQSKHRHFYWKCTASQRFDGQGSLNNITRIRNSGKCTPGEQVLLNREF